MNTVLTGSLIALLSIILIWAIIYYTTNTLRVNIWHKIEKIYPAKNDTINSENNFENIQASFLGFTVVTFSKNPEQHGWLNISIGENFIHFKNSHSFYSNINTLGTISIPWSDIAIESPSHHVESDQFSIKIRSQDLNQNSIAITREFDTFENSWSNSQLIDGIKSRATIDK